MEDVGILYRHLVYFTAVWYTFGIFCGNLLYILPVLVFYAKKNLATLLL
jgi:hypothetical protein